jgi:SAM-dependent methyltransferase
MTPITAAAPAFEYGAYPQIPVPACPCCGRPNASTPVIDRYGYRLGTSRCACGFGYLNPQLSADGYAAFYTHAYRPLITAQRVRQGHAPSVSPGAQEALYLMRARWIAAGAARLQPVRRVAALCDVGGGPGALVARVLERWPADVVTVIDPNQAELADAAAQGFTTIHAVAEDAPPLPPQDVILCAQTLDHVRDPLGVLRWLRSILAPGGWLYVDVCDARRVGSADYRHPAPYQWKLDHPCYWTPRTLLRALRATGWGPRLHGACERYHQAIWCERA